MRIRLRTLHLGSQTFTWQATIHHVPGSRDCHRCLRLRAWGAGKTGRALQADLLSDAWPTPWSACSTDTAYPTPAEVKILIEYALTHGWTPDRRGGTFVLSESEHTRGFALPGYLLTDRLSSSAGADPTTRVIQAYEQRRTT